jgi:hypothetical protein
MPKLVAEVRIRDGERFRLFVWELHQLAEKMRIEACPHAEALERAVDRLLDGGDDERAKE